VAMLWGLNCTVDTARFGYFKPLSDYDYGGDIVWLESLPASTGPGSSMLELAVSRKSISDAADKYANEARYLNILSDRDYELFLSVVSGLKKMRITAVVQDEMGNYDMLDCPITLGSSTVLVNFMPADTFNNITGLTEQRFLSLQVALYSNYGGVSELSLDKISFFSSQLKMIESLTLVERTDKVNTSIIGVFRNDFSTPTGIIEIRLNPSLKLKAGMPLDFDIALNFSYYSIGKVPDITILNLSLSDGSDGDVPDGDVPIEKTISQFISGIYPAVYVLSAPSGIVVDGAIGEWAGQDSFYSDAYNDLFRIRYNTTAGRNEREYVSLAGGRNGIDALQFGTKVMDNTFFAFVSYSSSPFLGQPIERMPFVKTEKPQGIEEISGSGGLIEGKNHTILSSKIYRADRNHTWQYAGDIRAALGHIGIEFSSDFAKLLTGNYTIRYISSDWTGLCDASQGIWYNVSSCSSGIIEDEEYGNGSGQHGSGSRNPQGTDLVINEISTRNPPPANDWIEIANPTDNPIDLTGWSIRYYDQNGILRTVYLSGTIPAWSPPPSTAPYIVIYIDNIRDSNSQIFLVNPAGEIVDSVSYTYLDNKGSLERYRDSITGKPVDTDSPSDWVTQKRPTPGRPNTSVIPEFAMLFFAIILPIALVLLVRNLRHFMKSYYQKRKYLLPA
ncbi:MAG: lamin tail domain-containing protein, partial [Thermoplasmata archaeon]